MASINDDPATEQGAPFAPFAVSSSRPAVDEIDRQRLVEAHRRMLGRHDAAWLEYRRARLAKDDARMDRAYTAMVRRHKAAVRLTDALARAVTR